MSGIEWRCENGHVLGLVMENGRGVKQLLLYREAKAKPAVVENMAGLIELLHKEDGRRRTGDGGRGVEVIAVVRYATDIICSICGGKKLWISRDKVEELGIRLEKLVQRGVWDNPTPNPSPNPTDLERGEEGREVRG